MLKDRIELESDENVSKRYEELTLGRQRAFEFCWELREVFGARLFGGLTDAAEKQLASSDPEEVGRRRFFRVTGPIKIPLPPLRSY